MPDILRMLSQAEQLDFSQNFLTRFSPTRRPRTSKPSTCVLPLAPSFPLWP